MKVVLFPYSQARRTSDVDKVTAYAKQAALRLQTYLGAIPSGSRLLLERASDSRAVGLALEDQFGGMDFSYFNWAVPKNSTTPVHPQFESIFRAIMTVDIPVVFLVIPSSYVERYAEEILRQLELPQSRLSMGGGHKIILIEAKAKDPVRMITV